MDTKRTVVFESWWRIGFSIETINHGNTQYHPRLFYPGSRTTEEEQIAERLHKMVNEGADIIDIGAYSSRPNADDISPDEEMKRLSKGLDIIRKLYPDARVSVDTFRADIAARCVREYGVQMINDISGESSILKCSKP